MPFELTKGKSFVIPRVGAGEFFRTGFVNDFKQLKDPYSHSFLKVSGKSSRNFRSEGSHQKFLRRSKAWYLTINPQPST